MCVLVIMGVSGTGKTTIGQAVAQPLGWAFQEGDDLHTPASVEKMRRGEPLGDDDRWPWLHRVAAVIDDWLRNGQHGVIACSALKRAYRRIIIGQRANIRLVYLYGDRVLLESRLRQRQGHYMPASLLNSQLETLEPPGRDENPIIADVKFSQNAIVSCILKQAGLSEPTN